MKIASIARRCFDNTCLQIFLVPRINFWVPRLKNYCPGRALPRIRFRITYCFRRNKSLYLLVPANHPPIELHLLITHSTQEEEGSHYSQLPTLLYFYFYPPTHLSLTHLPNLVMNVPTHLLMESLVARHLHTLTIFRYAPAYLAFTYEHAIHLLFTLYLLLPSTHLDLSSECAACPNPFIQFGHEEGVPLLSQYGFPDTSCYELKQHR